MSILNLEHTRLNGKLERSYKIDGKEFYWILEGELIDEVNPCQRLIEGMGRFVQCNKPHLNLGNHTIFERSDEYSRFVSILSITDFIVVG